ncbi:hypothetical protein ACFVW1_14495 [Streptomyces olivochromogenes]|uniref:hypothetical protein n=1 Tax=Streptomyces olivochromogenes TaxID=1963 RepID=UPI0036DA0C16
MHQIHGPAHPLDHLPGHGPVGQVQAADENADVVNAILTTSFNLAIFGGGSLGAVHAALLGAVDELHDTAQLSQAAWDAPRVHYEDGRPLELLVPADWYRTISYLTNGLLPGRGTLGHSLPSPVTALRTCLAVDQHCGTAL